MSDVNAKLKERKKAIQEEFDKLKTEREQRLEQGKQINQRLSAIEARQLQLQGATMEIDELLKPTPPAPKEKKESK